MKVFVYMLLLLLAVYSRAAPLKEEETEGAEEIQGKRKQYIEWLTKDYLGKFMPVIELCL